MGYAPQGSGFPPDPKVVERIETLIALQKASLSWFWRSLAIIVSLATIAGAVFEILSYFRG